MPTDPRQDPVAYRRALLEADDEEPMDDEDLESELVASVDVLSPPTDSPACLFYASWLVEMEVGNGGFGQFALNALEWFPAAARAYDAFGLPDVAAVVRAAYAVAKVEEAQILAARATRDVGAAARFFTTTALAQFDEHYESLCVTPERVAYARAHRTDFC